MAAGNMVLVHARGGGAMPRALLVATRAWVRSAPVTQGARRPAAAAAMFASPRTTLLRLAARATGGACGVGEQALADDSPYPRNRGRRGLGSLFTKCDL